MLAALARALRLTWDERNHLYHLAGHPLPPSCGTAAQVITDLHVTLVQNGLAVALLGPALAVTDMRASLVYRWFTEPSARLIYPAEDHPHHSRVFVAELLRASSEFAALWEQHDVAVRRNDRKRIVHSSWVSWRSTASTCSARTDANGCSGSPPPPAPKPRSSSNYSPSSAPKT